MIAIPPFIRPFETRHDICVVIPAYRETRRIGPFLKELLDAIAEAGDSTVVLVVDDGSGATETTRLREIIGPLFHKHPERLRLLELPQNQGKGGAILSGWATCPPSLYLGFIDADGAIAASEFVNLCRKGLASQDRSIALFASRVKMLGRHVERSVARHLMGRVFATVVSNVAGLDVYDSQCGCKLVPYSVYEKIRDKLQEKRFAFDVELMLAISRAGCRIEEVPINWRDVPGSKVSFLKDTVNMFFACLAIRRRAAKWRF